MVTTAAGGAGPRSRAALMGAIVAGAVGVAVAAVAAVAAVDAVDEAPGRGESASSARPGRWVERGARRLTLDADGVPLVVLQFNLSQFRADVSVGVGSPPAAMTAADLRASLGGKAVAVVNGGFFDDRRAPLGLRIAAGQTRVKLRPHVDWGVLVVSEHSVRIVHSNDFRASPEIRAAIQVGPRLVVGGVPLKLRAQTARRTAVAVDAEGRVLTLVIADVPIEAGALAARLAALGFDAALLLDGGPSTQLSFQWRDEHLEIAGGYAVPDLLTISAR